MDLEREKDLEELRRYALAQQTQIQQLIRALERKCKELEALKGSEGELQQTLALIEELSKERHGGPSGGEKPAPRPRKPRERSGPTPQPALPIVEKTYELDEADRVCPCCGGELYPLAGKFEESELIDVVEVSYHIKKVKRQKYVCRCGGVVETAPGPDRATPGGRYSLGFAAKVAVDKYVDHLPLTRQARILQRHGLEVTSQTLWDQLYSIADRLAPLDRALYERVMSEPVIGLDQTGWPKLGAGPKVKPWQMWCLTAPGVVLHRIRADKSAATFKKLVGNYEGDIVCDALSTHGAGAREGPGISLAGCWAHVFRRFEEAEPDHPEASFMLERIGRLYEIDAEAGGDLELLAELRRTKSRVVLDDMKDWLWAQATLKTLSIGKAAAYAIRFWDRLVRFASNPRIPLDNNATERGIRGPVVGRKNHYGSKSFRGTVVAARLYTIFETAKLHGIDPAAYLIAAVHACDRGEILMPEDFAG